MAGHPRRAGRLTDAARAAWWHQQQRQHFDGMPERLGRPRVAPPPPAPAEDPPPDVFDVVQLQACAVEIWFTAALHWLAASLRAFSHVLRLPQASR